MFHWPLSELREMEIDELLEWRKLALERAKALFGGPAGGAR
ncbi:MAG: GpE family phage tail protein [Bryobacterales bacterium]|nr:GpE family phage tail protein [Bryobacterales bacterium]